MKFPSIPLPFDGNMAIDTPRAPKLLCKEPNCPGLRQKGKHYCKPHQTLRDSQAEKRRIVRLDAERRKRWRIALTERQRLKTEKSHRMKLLKKRLGKQKEQES